MSFLKAKKSALMHVKDLNGTTTRAKIKVRILRLWTKLIKGFDYIDMVFVDEEGTRIHASVESDLVRKFRPYLVEGIFRVINNFKVKPITGDYRTSSHRFKIWFTRTTIVSNCDDFSSQVPEKYFESFSNMLDLKPTKTFLFDVLGQIINVGSLEELRFNGKTATKVDVTLKNESAGTHLVTKDEGSY